MCRRLASCEGAIASTAPGWEAAGARSHFALLQQLSELSPRAHLPLECLFRPWYLAQEHCPSPFFRFLLDPSHPLRPLEPVSTAEARTCEPQRVLIRVL